MTTHYKRFQKSGNYSIVEFDSLNELVTQSMDANSIVEANKYFYDDLSSRSGDEFTNRYTPARIQNELIVPPAAGVKVAEIAESIESQFDTDITVRRPRYRQEDGDELNAMSWIRRETDGWSRMEKSKLQRRVFRIAINLSCGSQREPQDLWYRGAAAVALADAMEAKGNSVEVVAFTAARGLVRPFSDNLSIMSVIVKHSHTPMDVDTLALVCAEIGFFRTMSFLAQISSAESEVNSCMGTVDHLPIVEAAKFDVVLDAGIFTKADAIAAVAKFSAKAVE